MGRRDAVQFTLEWAARARALGAVVTFQSGWESRGNGTSADYEGAIVHHTASASSEARSNPTLSLLIAGRSDLPGPLCNVTGPWCRAQAPRLHVVAAHPANHAGASGGRSMGPLPVTGLFNKRVFGLEIDYAGSSPMTEGQYRAALIFARATADVLGRSTEYVRAHAESSITGKWDPGYAPGKTIDMTKFRRDAATNALFIIGGLDMSDAQYNQIRADIGYIRDQILAKLDALPAAIVNQPFPNYVYDDKGALIPNKEVSIAASMGWRDTHISSLQKGDRDILAALAARSEPASAVVRELDYEALAAALAPKIADEWDRRARDGDPKTGPVT